MSVVRHGLFKETPVSAEMALISQETAAFAHHPKSRHVVVALALETKSQPLMEHAFVPETLKISEITSVAALVSCSLETRISAHALETRFFSREIPADVQATKSVEAFLRADALPTAFLRARLVFAQETRSSIAPVHVFVQLDESLLAISVSVPRGKLWLVRDVSRKPNVLKVNNGRTNNVFLSLVDLDSECREALACVFNVRPEASFFKMGPVKSFHAQRVQHSVAMIVNPLSALVVRDSLARAVYQISYTSLLQTSIKRISCVSLMP